MVHLPVYFINMFRLQHLQLIHFLHSGNLLKFLNFLLAFSKISFLFFICLYFYSTFFYFSGFLTCHILLKKFPKESSRFFFVKLYIHRYLRLTLVYGICILFFTGFLGRYGTGAMVRYISDYQVQVCKETWWRNILYVSNLIVSQSLKFET